jgi:hypothetical protein
MNCKSGISTMLALLIASTAALGVFADHFDPASLKIRGTAKRAMIDAAAKGNIPGLQLALQSGVDVDARGKGGVTALMMASTPEVAELLLSKGAEINNRENNGFTALAMAIIHDHLELAEFLLKKGAEVDARNVNGMSALWMASANLDVPAVALLLDNGADPNLRCEEKGITILEGQIVMRDMYKNLAILGDFAASMGGAAALRAQSLASGKPDFQKSLDIIGASVTANQWYAMSKKIDQVPGEDTRVSLRRLAIICLLQKASKSGNSTNKH